LPSSLRHLLFIVVPLIAVFAVLPGVYQNHLLLFNFVIFLTLAQGVNIIYGFTGYLPFGYVGFFGAGAYGFAIMVMHYQTPAVIAVLVGGLVDIGRAIYTSEALSNAAREGARHGVSFDAARQSHPGLYDAEIKLAVDAELATISIPASVLKNPGTTCPTDLVRLSVGIEHVEDLIGDIEQALG